MNNEIENREKKIRAIQSFDKSLFKGKDLGLVKKITEILDENNLEYILVGSARDNAIEGNPRNYNDIDILVPRLKKNDQNKYTEEIQRKYAIRKIYSDFDFKINDSGKLFYVEKVIDRRLQVQYTNPLETQTSIDLCFE